MYFKDYVRTIAKKGDVQGSVPQFVVDLFKAAGSTDIKHETAKSWIKSKRNPDASRHFTSDYVDEEGFVKFVKGRIRAPWNNVLDGLCEIDDTGVIKRDIDKSDEFFRCLLDLFLSLLKLQPKEKITLCHIPINKHVVFGREESIQKITEIFKISNYVVLTGIRGIGKSYTALAYAYGLQERGDWIIQHVHCEDYDILRTAVEQLQLDGFKENVKKMKFEQIIGLLKSYQRPVLIILDNLNNRFRPEDLSDFNKLIECGQHIKFLITSHNGKLIGTDKQHVVEINTLDIDTLIDLYKYHRFEKPEESKEYVDKHKEILKELFDKVGNNTLIITLLAKIPMRIGCSELKLKEALKDGLNFSTVIVEVTKDGIYYQDTMIEIMKKVFSVSQLSDPEKDTMSHMVLIPLSGMELELFEELTGYSFNGICNLIEANWIIIDDKKFRIQLHPLISETLLAMDETKPTMEKCNVFITKLKQKLKDTTFDNHIFHDCNKSLIHILAKIQGPFILEAPLKQEYSDAISTLNDVMKTMLDEYDNIASVDPTQMLPILEIIQRNFGDDWNDETED